MSDRPSFYEDIKRLGKLQLITYIENGERKQEKGSPEEIMKIYQRIQSNPKTMKLESVVPTE